MMYTRLGLFYLIALSVCWSSRLTQSIEPCNFLDSVNITDGVNQSNESIIFDGTKYPKEQYTSWDYIIENGVRRPVQTHIRGCICNLMPCIRLCCPFGSFHEIDNDNHECNVNEKAKDFLGEIIDPSNGANYAKLNQRFGIVDLLPCKSVFPAAGVFYVTRVNIIHYFGLKSAIYRHNIIHFISEWCSFI